MKENPITEIFYGTAEECISFGANEDSISKKYRECQIGIINLEVKFGDLYKAFLSQLRNSS